MVILPFPFTAPLGPGAVASADHRVAVAAALGPESVVNHGAPELGVFTIRMTILAIRHFYTRQEMHEFASLEETARWILDVPSPRVEVPYYL